MNEGDRESICWENNRQESFLTFKRSLVGKSKTNICVEWDRESHLFSSDFSYIITYIF